MEGDLPEFSDGTRVGRERDGDVDPFSLFDGKGCNVLDGEEFVPFPNTNWGDLSRTRWDGLGERDPDTTVGERDRRKLIIGKGGSNWFRCLVVLGADWLFLLSIGVVVTTVSRWPADASRDFNEKLMVRDGLDGLCKVVPLFCDAWDKERRGREETCLNFALHVGCCWMAYPTQSSEMQGSVHLTVAHTYTHRQKKAKLCRCGCQHKYTRTTIEQGAKTGSKSGQKRCVFERTSAKLVRLVWVPPTIGNKK